MGVKHWIQNLLTPGNTIRESWIRSVVTGSLYRVSDLYSSGSAIHSIKTQIDTMRALATDGQISTALSYYATDATVVNSANQIIWATSKDNRDVADIINDLFKKWKVNSYARDHILELATIGNLYIPTTRLYVDNKRRDVGTRSFGLDTNSITDKNFDIVASYKIPPEDIVHIYKQGVDMGYILNPEDKANIYELYPPESIIHFSLGGLLGDYTVDTQEADGSEQTYDIKFATPLMAQAVQPTQTLSLLEDALLLSSLIRTVKFINVDCGDTEETEIKNSLQQIKDAIEQQLSLNTGSGDVQSFVNPQSPNNLIYLPKVNGNDAISITDLNMSDSTENDSKLLDHFQDKKLSVLGVPKEAMNFSSNEGLGGAGSVLSQRSSLYANCLQRLKTAYIEGWTDAINKYFIARGMSRLVDKFDLHMAEIITTQSTITFEKRDAAIGQAQNIVQLLKDLGVANADKYKDALVEVFSEVLPVTSAGVQNWDVDVTESEGGDI